MKEAIILLNMGGPNNLGEVKVFLNNMFNDRRIIQAPSLIRKIISFLIVKSRLKEATQNYRELGGKSPIVDYTKSLIQKLEQKTGVETTFAMRYTPPFTKEALEKIQNVDKIYAIPLYPHFSSTTTQSSFDALFEEAKKLGIQDKIVTIDNYHLNPQYNEAIINSIQESLEGEDPSQYDLIFSAHGLPQKIIDQGDLYQKHIKENVAFASQLLEEKGIHFNNVHLAYQSRVGPLQWTKPYLDEKLKELSNKKVLLYPIAFTVDNSETEFELDVEYREVAEELGYESYKVAKAPNDDPAFIDALNNIYEQIKSEANNR